MTSVALDIALLFGAVVALWLGSRWFVDGASALARRAGVSELLVGLTVVSIGTSAPELVVTVDAAVAGRPDVAVGNVVGSNVYNLAVVLGSVALVGSVRVTRLFLRRDAVVLVASSALLLALVSNGRLARTEGALLLALFVGYLGLLFRQRARREDDAPGKGAGPEPTGTGRLRLALALVGGLVLLLGGGRLLVESAVSLARLTGVSEWVIGSTVVAAGTSTPELAVSVLAALRGQVGVSVGNVVGSNAFNALLVLGTAGALAPAPVSPAAATAAAWLCGLSALAGLLLWTGRVVTRWEGGVLLASEAVRWTWNFLG